MSYRDQLQLKFHPQAFAVKNTTQTNFPLELISKSKNISPIASLVLQSLQRHLSSIQQSRISPKQLLRFVTDAWNRMLGLENEARMLEFCGVTRLTLSGPDEKSLSLRARCTLLGTASSSTPGRKGSAAKSTAGAKRIDVDFSVRTRIQTENSDALPIGYLDFDVDVLATKVYGFGSGNKSGLANADMKTILGKGLAKQNVDEDDAQLGNGVWCKAVRVLQGSVF
jgi:kinetochore protein Spc7/SPC105